MLCDRLSHFSILMAIMHQNEYYLSKGMISMIKTNESKSYTLTQLRNAEDFLTELDEVYYSLVKINREYRAIITSSGPEGYPDHSTECPGISKHSYLSSEQTLCRMEQLKDKYRCLKLTLHGLKNDLAKIRGTKEFCLLYFRFKKGLSVIDTANKMNSSLRNYYRIRKRALIPVCDSLIKTELGKQILEQGSKAAIHIYFK